MLISKNFKEVLVYSYATHTLNYSSVGIRVSNVFNQSKAAGEKRSQKHSDRRDENKGVHTEPGYFLSISLI